MSIRVPLAPVLLAFAACRGAVERTAPASEEHAVAGADVAIPRVPFESSLALTALRVEG